MKNVYTIIVLFAGLLLVTSASISVAQSQAGGLPALANRTGALETRVAELEASTGIPGYEIIESAPLNFSAGGWAGWSCPDGKVILSGGVEGVSARTSIPAGPESVWPHYTFGVDEYGWVVQSAEAGTATIRIVCADSALN